MKTTAITFALLVATILNANASTVVKGHYGMHKKNTSAMHEKTDTTRPEHHGPKAKRNNNIVRDDVMWNRF